MHYKHENDNEVLDLERLVACEAKLVKRLAHGLILHSIKQAIKVLMNAGIHKQLACINLEWSNFALNLDVYKTQLLVQASFTKHCDYTHEVEGEVSKSYCLIPRLEPMTSGRSLLPLNGCGL